MVDGNAFAREFREVSTTLRPRELEEEGESDVTDYVRGVSEAFAFVAMRLAGEDRGPYDRWLEGLVERAPETQGDDG